MELNGLLEEILKESSNFNVELFKFVELQARKLEEVIDRKGLLKNP